MGLHIIIVCLIGGQYFKYYFKVNDMKSLSKSEIPIRISYCLDIDVTPVMCMNYSDHYQSLIGILYQQIVRLFVFTL